MARCTIQFNIIKRLIRICTVFRLFSIIFNQYFSELSNTNFFRSCESFFFKFRSCELFKIFLELRNEIRLVNCNWVKKYLRNRVIRNLLLDGKKNLLVQEQFVRSMLIFSINSSTSLRKICLKSYPSSHTNSQLEMIAEKLLEIAENRDGKNYSNSL